MERTERVTVRVPRRVAGGVDRLVEEGEYPNRSEAIRDALRTFVDDRRDRPVLVSDGGHSE